MVQRGLVIFCLLALCQFLGDVAYASQKQVDASLAASWDGTPLVLEALEFLVRNR